MAQPSKQSSEPVSLYAEDPRLPRMVRRDLEEHAKGLKEALATGASKDFPDYRERVGELRGVETAIRICTEYESSLSGN